MYKKDIELKPRKESNLQRNLGYWKTLLEVPDKIPCFHNFLWCFLQFFFGEGTRQISCFHIFFVNTSR